jgi:hypothetical protein
MKLKTILLDGVSYAVLDAAGLPVYVHDDNKEVGFDAPSANSRITALNAESAGRRTELAEAQGKLKAFEGIEDPEKAKAAIATVANLAAGDLVQAGKVEEIKVAAIAATEDKYKGQITALTDQVNTLTSERDGLRTSLNDTMIGGSFTRSKYIEEKVAVPADVVEAMFGKNFKVEDGKLVGYDAAGGKIYSRSKPGEVADFEEAIEYLIGAYPRKEHILKGTGGSGGGSEHGGAGTAGKNPWKKDQLNLTEQDRIQAKDPALASRLKAEAGVA